MEDFDVESFFNNSFESLSTSNNNLDNDFFIRKNTLVLDYQDPLEMIQLVHYHQKNILTEMINVIDTEKDLYDFIEREKNTISDPRHARIVNELKIGMNGERLLHVLAHRGYGHVIDQLYSIKNIDPLVRCNKNKLPSSFAFAKGNTLLACYLIKKEKMAREEFFSKVQLILK